MSLLPEAENHQALNPIQRRVFIFNADLGRTNARNGQVPLTDGIASANLPEKSPPRRAQRNMLLGQALRSMIQPIRSKAFLFGSRRAPNATATLSFPKNGLRLTRHATKMPVDAMGAARRKP